MGRLTGVHSGRRQSFSEFRAEAVIPSADTAATFGADGFDTDAQFLCDTGCWSTRCKLAEHLEFTLRKRGVERLIWVAT